jgi:hypothetical protein
VSLSLIDDYLCIGGLVASGTIRRLQMEGGPVKKWPQDADLPDLHRTPNWIEQKAANPKLPQSPGSNLLIKSAHQAIRPRAAV